MSVRSEFVNHFLNIYHTLTKFQKKSFKYMHWMARKFRHVFVSVLNIATNIKCCKRTVSRCTNLFEELGWIIKIKHGYRSNDYFMNEELIALDLDDPTLFLRGECLQNVPVLESSSSECIYIGTKSTHICDKKEQKNRHIPEFLNIKGLSIDEQQRLANQFSEYSLKHSLEDAKWYVKQGNKIKTLIGSLWAGAVRYSS